MNKIFFYFVEPKFNKNNYIYDEDYPIKSYIYVRDRVYSKTG